MVRFLSIIGLLFTINLSQLEAVETRGILEPLFEAKNINMGEAYPYRLTLVPIEKRLVQKERLEGQKLVGNFHVVNVNSIKISENNVDAVITNLDLVVSQEMNFNQVYIWQLGDRNIPIEVPQLQLNKVQLATRDFIVFNSPWSGDETSFPYVKFIIGLVIVFGVLIGLYMIKEKFPKAEQKEVGVAKQLANLNSHEDLENLYKERRLLLDVLSDKKVESELRDFFRSYERTQFSPDWKKTDIGAFVKRGKELSREIKGGV